jgi:uncharacterized protein YbjQ (UPF0145 family)
MGTTASTQLVHGTLKGAYPPPIRHETSSRPPPLQVRSFEVTIPPGHGPGNVFAFVIEGRKHSVTVPAGKKAGDKIMYTYKVVDLTKVYASTLHALPGMAIVSAKPIVFGSVSYAFLVVSTGISGQLSMGQQVGRLMQEAQDEILRQAIELECNAVLGMSFTVTNDSSGDAGRSKLVIVTVCGTPCVIMPQSEQDIPVVQATAMVVPLYLDNGS